MDKGSPENASAHLAPTFFTAPSRLSGVAPRNASVRWKFFAGTARTPSVATASRTIEDTARGQCCLHRLVGPQRKKKETRIGGQGRAPSRNAAAPTAGSAPKRIPPTSDGWSRGPPRRVGDEHPRQRRLLGGERSRTTPCQSASRHAAVRASDSTNGNGDVGARYAKSAACHLQHGRFAHGTVRFERRARYAEIPHFRGIRIRDEAALEPRGAAGYIRHRLGDPAACA